MALAGLALGRIDVRIDLVCVGADVPRVVADLAKVSGVKLTAPAVFKRDIIMLSVHQAPLKSVMERVANLCAAEWKSDETGFQLVVSAEKRRAEEAREREALRAAYARAIEIEKKKAAGLPAWSVDYAKATRAAIDQLDGAATDDNSADRYEILSARTPSGRGLTRLLALADPGFLADHWRQGTVVFSTQPTRMQFPMPSGAGPALDALKRECDDWAARTADEPDSPRRYDGRGKVVLILHLGDSRRTGEIQAELWVANANRFVSMSSRATVTGSPTVTLEYGSVGREEPLDSGPFGRWLAENHRDDALPSDLRGAVLHPESREPLSLMLGPILIQCAQTRHENLIASAPDSLASIGAWVARSKATPRAFLDAFDGEELAIKEADGWMSVAPRFPVTARRERVDRATTGVFVRMVSTLGNDLDAWAGYAASAEGELRSSIGYQWMRLVDPTALTGEDGPTLRFYGELSPSAREALGAGPLLLSSLSQEARATVERLVYAEGALARPTGSFGDYPDLLELPSEALPTGIPSNSTLALDRRSTTVLVAPPFTAADGSRHPGRALGYADVAAMLYRMERPDADVGVAEDPDFRTRKFGLASRENLVFQFDFTRESRMTRFLHAVRPPTQAVTYAQSPADFRKQVEDALAKLRSGGEAMRYNPPLRLLPADASLSAKRGTPTSRQEPWPRELHRRSS